MSKRMTRGSRLTYGLIAVGALLLSATASAQTNEDRAYVSFSLARGTAIGSGGGKLANWRQWDLRMPLPPVFLGKTIIVPSLAYETRWLALEPQGVLVGRDEDDLGRRFHRIQLGLTVVRPLAPRWLMFAGVSSTARTDFRSSFDVGMDMSWVGYAMANYLIGGDPGMRLMFGAVVMWPFNVLPVIPIVGFSYRKGPYVVELGLPRLTLLRKFGDGLELGVAGMFDQQVFHARMPDDGQALGAHFVRETSLHFGPTANVRLGGGTVWLSTSVGLDVLNDFALLDRDRKALELGASSTRPAPFLRVALNWRPPRPASKVPVPSVAPEQDTPDAPAR
ncbi:hypothetical protein JY651_16060 [Pyxidicoccus parkwayensis]|uniref:Transporter n=1 Tax=Pyxidicoccus parkwayensis TaxID=2813578 RepID=A0ABX7P7B8_9BACT|nr:hypothetical protein [Pyxidicoccus parkwaysis]QSQ26351.1 hypothetical protein JY651_16060 [Pyxidicoccus parkwaysis]